MKKNYYILAIFTIVILVFFSFLLMRTTQKEESPEVSEDSSQEIIQEEISTSLANPASQYCEENGGKLEIITNKDGSQLGMCQFENYACEEWAYFNGECDIEEDTQKIKKALIDKGLNLTDMKVVIYKHLGKFIEAAVVPVSAPAGGGYVFAVKEKDIIKVLADGNGAIMCDAFIDYPEFSTYLVSECIDESGNPVSR